MAKHAGGRPPEAKTAFSQYMIERGITAFEMANELTPSTAKKAHRTVPHVGTIQRWRGGGRVQEHYAALLRARYHGIPINPDGTHRGK